MDGYGDQRDQADGDERRHDEREPRPGVVFEPSVWRSIRTPFSSFSRIIIGMFS